MSRDTRFDKLESAVVDALRRAPGIEPSADLDARIRARAHAAVAKPSRRPQPFWYSMAAGLVVLVGTGLALRIAEQVERAPSALDLPSAQRVQTPATGAPAAESAVAADSPAAGNARADVSVADDSASASSELARPKREQPAPGAPAALEQRMPTQPGAEVRREVMGVESRQEGLSSLSAAPPAADKVMPTAPPAPRPFPAEPASGIPTQEEAPMAARVATPVAPPAAAPGPSVPPPHLLPPPMQAAPTPIDGAAVAATEADSAKSRAAAGASVAPATTADAGRDFAAPAKPAAEADRERQLDAPIETQFADPFESAVAAVRKAVARGDLPAARQLALALQRDYPQREMPKDVQALVDAAR